MAWFSSWLKKVRSLLAPFNRKLMRRLLPRLSFQKEDPEDYERILANISLSISSKQTRLSEIRIRERRATLLVTLYAFGGWLLYLALWWTVLPRLQLWTYHSRDDMTLQSIIKAIPAVVGPVLIVFIRRIVQRWYSHKAGQEEKQLKDLMAEQRKKIDEIKKKTNYYSTKNLLDRYDDSPSKKPNGPSTPTPSGARLRQRHNQANPQSPLASLAVPGRPNGPGPQRQPAGPERSLLAAQYLKPTPQPMTPPQRQWYDRVADAILGEDEASSATVHSRYALVCESCFSHNGLVRESEWDNMQYVCPKCGHFNPSPRMRREHPESIASSRAPTAAPTPMTATFAGSLDSPTTSRSRFEDAQNSRSRMSDVQEASPSPSTERRTQDSGQPDEPGEDSGIRSSSPMRIDG